MGVNLDAIRRKVQELQTGRRTSNVQLWKPDVGSYKIRGIPWPAKFIKDDQPFIERWFYYIGEERGMLAPYQFGKEDPINDFTRKLYSTKNADDRLMAKKLRPKGRTYLPIVVREGTGADPKNVLIWSFGYKVHQKLLSYFLKEDIGDFLDPETGFDIDVTITKPAGMQFFNTDIDLARRPSKLATSREEINALAESVPNIDDMYKLGTPEELKAALDRWLADGGSDGNDEGSSGGAESKPDALDELVNDVKNQQKAESKSEGKTNGKKSTKAPKPKDDDEADVKKQTLDEAFDELMNEED